MKLTPCILSDAPLVPIVYIRVLLKILVAQGIDRRLLLSHCAIDEQLIKDPEAHLSIGQLLDVFSLAIALDGQPALGVRYGNSLDLSTHGMLACSLFASNDMHALIRIANQFVSVRMPLVRSHVAHEDTTTLIDLDDLWPVAGLRNFLVECHAASICRIASNIGMQCIVRFRHHCDHAEEDYERLLGCRVTFGAPHNQLVLHTPVKVPNNSGSTLAAQTVTAMIRHQITVNPGRGCTVPRIAERMGTTARTLSRHLRSSGISFSDLRNTVRHQLALHYLAQQELTISDIAERLGYSDQAAFTKAFRGWTGEPPGTLRRRLLEGRQQKGGTRPPFWTNNQVSLRQR